MMKKDLLSEDLRSFGFNEVEIDGFKDILRVVREGAEETKSSIEKDMLNIVKRVVDNED